MARVASVPASAFVGALCLILAAWPALNPVAAAAERRAAQVVAAAGATYVSLRAINAALSVAEEVELGASLGVGASLNPLGWLEPVDDTVERIASLVFAVTVLSGVLSVAFAPVALVGLVMAALGLIGGAACASLPARAGRDRIRRGLASSTALGLGLALVLPLAFLSAAWLGGVLTGAETASAEATLRAVADRAEALIRVPDLADLNEYRRAMAEAAGYFWDQADDILRAAATLSGAYLLQLVVLPAVLLAVALAALRRAL